MAKKFKKGELYKVRFKDHCVGSKEVMVCEVVGWLVKQDRDSIVLSSWVVITEDQQVFNDNHEPTTILKSCIIRKRKF